MYHYNVFLRKRDYTEKITCKAARVCQSQNSLNVILYLWEVGIFKVSSAFDSFFSMISNNTLWISANFQQDFLTYLIQNIYFYFKLLGNYQPYHAEQKEKGKEFAENILCSKRPDMDDILCKMAEIQFFYRQLPG